MIVFLSLIYLLIIFSINQSVIGSVKMSENGEKHR